MPAEVVLLTVLGMVTLIIATRNRHKVEEIRTILGPEFDYHTLNDLPDAPVVLEDAPSFRDNAARKSVALAAWLSGCATVIPPPGEGSFRQPAPGGGSAAGRVWVLADDSGLEVDALGGAPGVHSARFAALDSGKPGNSSDAENNAKLLRLLEGVPAGRRTGRFRCVIALTPVLPAGPGPSPPDEVAAQLRQETRWFEGACEGHIQETLRGQGGFGYDPLFVPGGFEQSFAELGESVKNGLSHRARALARLKASFDYER